MTQDSSENAGQALDKESSRSTELPDGKQPSRATDKLGEIQKKFASAGTALEEEIRTVGDKADALVKHPKRCAELGAGFAESLAGDSLGEVVGGALGSVLGPEGTVIGAEAGSIAGEVFGAHEGEDLAKKLLHDKGSQASFEEDVQEAGTAEASGKVGEKIGGMIGDALFHDAELGDAVGEIVGELSGEIAYKKIAKKKTTKEDLPSADDNAQN